MTLLIHTEGYQRFGEDEDDKNGVGGIRALQLYVRISLVAPSSMTPTATQLTKDTGCTLDICPKFYTARFSG